LNRLFSRKRGVVAALVASTLGLGVVLSLLSTAPAVARVKGTSVKTAWSGTKGHHKPSPSPSPTATSTPTATPTATSSSTPTATPTVTSSSTPTATPTVTSSSTPTSTSTPTPTPTSTSTHKLLIHHGWDMPTVGQVANHAALIDSRPFDGITVSLGSLSGATISGTAHSVSEYANALAAMPALRNVTHNFICLQLTQSNYNWYDNTLWATAAQNAANLATAMKATGKFDGIFLDVEYYGGGTNLWDYPTATPSSTAADAANLVASRGKQVADGIYNAWSSAAVLVTYGAWVSDPATSLPGYNNVAWANELMGSFDVGITESAYNHVGSTYVDGGEVYTLRSLSDFQALRNWEKTGLADSGSALIPSSFDSGYKSVISASVGVYDYDMNNGYALLSASVWQSLLSNALQTADKYVWAYNEAYDWLGTGYPAATVPQAYLDATAAARASA